MPPKTTVRRFITFDYFKVVTRPQPENTRIADTTFDFRLWIQKATRLSLEGRTFDYAQERARLEQAGFDSDAEQWFVHFLRLRESMLPSIATLSSNVEPIELDDDEFLSEEVTGLYDENCSIMMLQRNRYSLSPSGIEEYLNLVWSEETSRICLRPISSNDNVDRATRGNGFRKLVLRFADLDTKIIPPTIGSRISDLLRLATDFNSVNAEITFTAGRRRDKSLEPGPVTETIRTVVDHRDFIASAKVAVRTDDDKVEIIDLFDEKAQSGTYFDVPVRTTLAHDAIFGEMAAIWSDSKSRILGYLEPQ